MTPEQIRKGLEEMAVRAEMESARWKHQSHGRYSRGEEYEAHLAAVARAALAQLTAEAR